jgi:hypothetical protein
VKWLLPALLSCVAAPAMSAAAVQPCVPLATLIAHPAEYQGKTVWVAATASIEFENMTACPPNGQAKIEDCLWLNIDDGPYRTDQDYARYEAKRGIWSRFHRQTVAIHATFDAAERGHFSMRPGGLVKVTEVSAKQAGWSFASNAATPAVSCAATR